MPYDRIPAVNEDDEFPPAVRAALGIPNPTDILATTGTPAADGTASRGVSAKAARSDHVHPSNLTTGATPTNIAKQGDQEIGDNTTAARSDHVHAMPNATEVAIVAGSGIDMSSGCHVTVMPGFRIVNFIATTTALKAADGTLCQIPSGHRPSNVVYGTFAESLGGNAISVYLDYTTGNLKTNRAISDATGIRGQLVYAMG